MKTGNSIHSIISGPTTTGSRLAAAVGGRADHLGTGRGGVELEEVAADGGSFLASTLRLIADNQTLPTFSTLR
jgi:hypothetical protein